MKIRSLVTSVVLGLALGASPLVAQEEEVALDEDGQPQALPSAALPFVAIKPCRLADTRDGTFPAGYGPPALTAGVIRVFSFAGRCGIPTTIDAVSANLTVVNTGGAGFIATFPTGTAQPSPLVSALNYSGANQVVANAAVIPVGAVGQANILAGVAGTDLIIDVNGYYPSTGLVTSLNSIVGDVTLAAGANVTVTPSLGTVTISTSVPAGPTGPTGAIGPTGPTGPNTYLNQACPTGQVLSGFNGSGGIVCTSFVGRGKLYMIRDSDDTLQQLNPATLAITNVGGLGIASYDFGDCAWNPSDGTLYMVEGRNTNQLFRVNLATGAATLIGTHGITDMFALGYHPPTNAIYGIGSGNFYQMNLTTGAATLIGPTGTGGLEGLAWDSNRSQFVALQAGTADLYTINVATGVATVFNTAAPSMDDGGLTYDPVIDRFWAVDYAPGGIFQYNPTAGYVRTTPATGQGTHTCIAFVP